MSSEDGGEELRLNDKCREIPLSALRSGARRKIALFLNLEGSLNDDTGLINNFKGLAELIGFDYLEICNFELQRSATENVLHEWTTRSALSPTIGNLRDFLVELQRYDVLTDVWDLLMKDCDNYLKIKAQFRNDVAPIQDYTVSSGSPDTAPDHHVNETIMMTVQDVENSIQTLYDAFICYSPEGNDLQFVKTMIDKLEGEFGLKLFVPWRDDLPGASHNTICAKLIETRCKRMVIVLSQLYLKSSSCDFQTKFAHSLSPGSRSKRLVPILVESCLIPDVLRHVTLCDYTKQDLREWFWKRLAQALKAPLDPENHRAERPSDLQCVSLDTSSQVSVWSASGPVSSLYSRSSGSSASASPRDSVSSQAGYASITQMTGRVSPPKLLGHHTGARSSSPMLTSMASRSSSSSSSSASHSNTPPPLPPPKLPRANPKEYFC